MDCFLQHPFLAQGDAAELYFPDSLGTRSTAFHAAIDGGRDEEVKALLDAGGVHVGLPLKSSTPSSATPLQSSSMPLQTSSVASRAEQALKPDSSQIRTPPQVPSSLVVSQGVDKADSMAKLVQGHTPAVFTHW